MKPAYITYTNGEEPYVSMASRLEKQVADLKAGLFHCFHFDEDGNNREFFSTARTFIYSKIAKLIKERPIVFLDADHALLRPIEGVFEATWDIAAVYRSRFKNQYGRHDFCGGLVMLNNQRPVVIEKFWLEWINRTRNKPQQASDKCPRTLIKRGWLATWHVDQTALNDILLPKNDKKIVFDEVYQARDYRILPLKWHLYSSKSRYSYLIHYKGVKKKLGP